MGEVVPTLVRAGAAVTTGGFSELARKKPFQPGGKTTVKGGLTQAALGPYGSASAGGAAAAMEAVTPKIPDLPTAPKTPSIETAAVQQAASEAAARRSRSRGFRSTILNTLAQQPLTTTLGS